MTAWQFSVCGGGCAVSEVLPGLGVAWVTSAVPRTLAALALVLDFSLAMVLDFSRACLTMELMQTRLDGEEHS